MFSVGEMVNGDCSQSDSDLVDDCAVITKYCSLIKSAVCHISGAFRDRHAQERGSQKMRISLPCSSNIHPVAEEPENAQLPRKAQDFLLAIMYVSRRLYRDGRVQGNAFMVLVTML